ncbi:hypothetical protein [Sporosarcina trichiuri]|uniref:hypothetical protein n=1 Tax=Sporosarcina trichiuri TaxID=3056445 RepID=UPI0025B2BD56|nr:hypothetical protein [Sporosarcina sp. 0.2-SM1T-5]WJY27908.1 hypothetical protein QWT68_02720 [Sporosarcina sp. 0.2-SM1T-5]
MSEADELALSFYLPLVLILAVIDITVGAYWSLEGKHSKKLAAVNLLVNMSWTCTLFPLLLDKDLFSRSLEAIYEGTRREVHPFSEPGLFWCSLLLVTLLLIVNTVDVHQCFKSADQPASDD